MPEEFTLRLSVPQDRAAFMALYPRAFPQEDLTGLVGTLLEGGPSVLSLVACEAKGPEGPIGHVAFTLCAPDPAGAPQAALLAPLAVAPERQGRGLGRRLVEAGLARLSGQGVRQVFVLGDPALYRRFGFAPERQVAPPYPMPPEWADAWQSLCFPGAAALSPGPLPLPQVWLDPVFWQP